MKSFIFTLITFLVIGCSGKSDSKKKATKIIDSEFVEVYEEPRHQLVFENKDFKVLDIQIKAGDTTLFHRHRNPMFYTSLGWQKSTSQLLNSEWNKTGSEEWMTGGTGTNASYVTQPMIHRVTNTGIKLSRLIGVLNTSKSASTSNTSAINKASNRWFRSERIELIPGDTLNYQKSEFPIVIILVSGDEIEVIKNNKSSIHNKKWLQVEERSQLINSNESKIEIIQIEVLN